MQSERWIYLMAAALLSAVSCAGQDGEYELPAQWWMQRAAETPDWPQG